MDLKKSEACDWEAHDYCEGKDERGNPCQCFHHDPPFSSERIAKVDAMSAEQLFSALRNTTKIDP